MQQEQDYIRDIAEMRSLMERSSKFLSLSGLAGIMAGVYALAGAYIAYRMFSFEFSDILYSMETGYIYNIILLAGAVLFMAVGTALFLSYRNANKKGEKFWNATARRLLINMAVPLVTGGLLILIFMFKGAVIVAPPLSLIFYGLALYNSSKFTFEEMRSLGIIQIILGLTACVFVEYGLLFWAIGFGLAHIVYGIYLHYRYER